MKIHICSSLAEIAHRLTFNSDPLGIFSLLNFRGPTNWRFAIGFDESRSNTVLIVSDGVVEAVCRALETAHLPLYVAKSIEIVSAGKRWRAAWRDQLAIDPYANTLNFECVADAAVPDACVQLHAYCGEVLPPEFSSVDQLRSYVYRKTWFGSRAIRQTGYELTVSIIATERRFQNRWRLADDVSTWNLDGKPVLDVSVPISQPPVGTLHLTKRCGQRGSSIAWAHSGVMDAAESVEVFGADLLKAFDGADIEIQMPGRALAPDGTVARDDSFNELLIGLRQNAEALEQRAEVRAYQSATRVYERRVGAARIDQRKAELERCDFVYWKERLVYKAPTNEMELVALHQKLEGLGAIPFRFDSLEYTPKIGIDAIANFKLDQSRPLSKLATVEFEYLLENYFRHEHPTEHTDLIVCWDSPLQLTNVNLQLDRERRWLGVISMGNDRVPVILVKYYPQLVTRKLERV